MSAEDELSPEQADALRRALASACNPREIPADRHERLLREALEDPLAPPTAAELAEAEALRLELEAPTTATLGDAALARALAHAAVGGGRGGDDAVLERSLERALPGQAPRTNVVFVAFGAISATLSLAAAAALFIMPVREAPSLAHPPALSRSLAPLLGADAQQLSASARMDRIASTRARELRENRYLTWGVR